MAEPGARRSGDGGFTLIELLVAIVIGGIVVGVLFQMIGGQGRFVELQSAREEVQQNSRAALELIGSEIRSMPHGSALVAASDDAITLRATRFSGVVCGTAHGGAALDVVFPEIPGVSWAVNQGTGVIVHGDTSSGWDHARVSSIGGAASVCGSDPVAPGAEVRRITMLTPLSSVELGDVVSIGDEVTYRSGTSSVDGLWIQRRLGTGTHQPFAGPILDDRGLRFDYFAGHSATPLPTPITDPALRESVTRIAVSVAAVSRNRVAGEAQMKVDSLVVSLRNPMLPNSP